MKSESTCIRRTKDGTADSEREFQAFAPASRTARPSAPSARAPRAAAGPRPRSRPLRCGPTSGSPPSLHRRGAKLAKLATLQKL